MCSISNINAISFYYFLKIFSKIIINDFINIDIQIIGIYTKIDYFRLFLK